MARLKSPWYISARAVRDYCELRCLGDPDDEDVFVAAEEELADWSRKILDADKEPKPTDGGHLLYRLPKRTGRGLRLIVSTSKRVEGGLPQLIAVKR